MTVLLLRRGAARRGASTPCDMAIGATAPLAVPVAWGRDRRLCCGDSQLRVAGSGCGWLQGRKAQAFGNHSDGHRFRLFAEGL